MEVFSIIQEFPPTDVDALTFSYQKEKGKELDIFKRLLLLFFSNWLFHSLSILFY